MRELQWLSETEFRLAGVQFKCALGDYALEPTEDQLVILKNRGALDQYAAVVAGEPLKNMLEFGIFQGGSPVLFSLWFDLEKFVGVDICAAVDGFERFCRSHEVGKRIRSFYEVSQTNRGRIEAIIRTEFGATPIDAIIDDASHAYGATRRTFETAFPFLRPGGLYVIEDWGWAHWPNSRLHQGQTALSMLIMELLMVCASRSDVISEVRVFPAFAFVRKSPDAPALENFRLDDLYRKRGIELVGARNFNLAGVGRTWAEGVADSTKRALQRAKRRILRNSRRSARLKSP